MTTEIGGAEAEGLAAITEILAIFDDDPLMTAELLAITPDQHTAESAALVKVREIGRRVVADRGTASGSTTAEAAAAPAADVGPVRIKVTVTDLGTGDTDEAVIEDNYVLVCAGSCYREHVQADLANGTHVITVKGVKR